APEAVPAFDPESVTPRRQILDGELGLRPVCASRRRVARPAGYCVDKGPDDPVRVAKIGVDVFTFDGKVPALPEAVEADRGEPLADVQNIRSVSADVAGEAEIGRQRRAVPESPGSGTDAALTVDRASGQRGFGRQL